MQRLRQGWSVSLIARVLLLLLIALAATSCGGGSGRRVLVADFNWVAAEEVGPLAVKFINTSVIGTATGVVYEWQFGDGVESVVREPVHNYEEPGTYDVTLTVRTATAASKPTTKTVTVPVTVLEPGGLIEGIDGVTVGAPIGAITQDLGLSIERRSDPRPDVPFPPAFHGVEQIGQFYSLRAAQDTLVGEDSFLLLGLPVPAGAVLDDLVIAALSPPGSVIMFDGYEEDDPSMRWELLQGTYDEESGLFGTILPFVGTEEQIYALVSLEKAANVDFSASSIEGFRIIRTGFSAGESPATHGTMTENALDAVRNRFVLNLGYREPRLRKVVTGIRFKSWPPSFTVLERYEYQLRKGSLNGWYNWVHQTAGTVYPGAPTEPAPFIARHEFYHALQFGYPNLYTHRNEALFGVIEGTAVAAEHSLMELTRSDATFTSRNPLTVDQPILQRTVADGATARSYQHQDFFVYIAKRMNPTAPQVSAFIPILERGGRLDDIDLALRMEGTFASLSDAYWQWARNQSFEKTVRLGVDSHGQQVPHGTIYQWSGHGSLNSLTYEPTASNILSPSTFTLTPLTSRVYRVTFQPLPDQTYWALVSIDDQPNLEWQLYAPLQLIIPWPIIPIGPLSMDAAQVNRRVAVVRVDSTSSVERHLLISNTRPSDSSGSVRVVFSEPIRGHIIDNVQTTPSSPVILAVGEDLSFTFDYETYNAAGVRITGRPLTDGQLTPNYSAHGSPLYPVGFGTGSGYFTFATPAVVDQIRLQMRDDTTNNVLAEKIIDVDIEFVNHSVEILRMEPVSPAVLKPGNNVVFSFRYSTSEPGGVRIFGRPLTNGQLTPDYAAHGSTVYPQGSGSGSGFFTVNSPNTVDALQIQMWNANQTTLLYEAVISVNYEFK